MRCACTLLIDPTEVPLKLKPHILGKLQPVNFTLILSISFHQNPLEKYLLVQLVPNQVTKYQLTVVVCTCCRISAKIFILLKKWGHFFLTQNLVLRLR